VATLSPRSRGLACVLAAAVALGSWLHRLPVAAAAESVVVFAAASLKNALDDIALEWRSAEGGRATLVYAGSSVLARQIQQGAPADVLISANVDWMDALEKDGLIRTETRRDLLGNQLVLIAHGKDVAPIELAPGVDLMALLGDQRLAMALVDAVPAGVYGKAALISLGIWDEIAPRVAQTDNVRAALALVARGEAPYGIVYATDAVAEAAVSVVATFPAKSHPPIVYPAAVTAESTNPAAPAFLAFLSSQAARPLFERQGFGVIE